MSFVVRRPSLPIGTTIQGFPAIRTALHADVSCEVYLLDSDPRWSLLLVLVPIGSESASVVGKRLVRWWSRLGPERLAPKKISENSETTGAFFEAVVQVKGEWLGKGTNPALNEPALYALLTGLVNLAEEGTEESLLPRFQPSLLWKSEDAGGTRVASLVAAPPGGGDERAMVRDIGRVVYWLAAGIDLFTASTQGPPPLLSRWSKGAGPRLSGLVARCVGPEKGGKRIESLGALRAEVEREGYGGRPKTENRTPSKATTKLTGSPEPQLRGLAKVAGMRELKNLLENEVIRPLRDPEPFQRYGLTVPNGVLLYGPPGCGKTYIARQLAEELGQYFVEIIPSEIASPYIHGSTIRIRDVFETAAEHAPSVLFIDEFEALVPSRAELGGFQQYKAEEVNEFLAHLNSCTEKKIFVIAATNEPQKIDAAVRRTGRLDKLIYVGPPDAEARAEMLRLHLSKRPVDDSLDVFAVADVLVGYSASDIKFLVDEAARFALGRGAPISTETIMEARRRVPPSVTKEDEQRYQGFTSRGI